MPESSPCATGRVPMDDLVQAMRAPPCSPLVAAVLKRHLANTNAPLGEIVEFIRWDPGLAARVLQVANSALFTRGERCHAIDVAVGRIGFMPVYEIASDAVNAIEPAASAPLVSYRWPAGECLRRSFACGLAAERLAGLRDEDPHVAYSLGFFHAVGMMAIDRWTRVRAPDMLFLSRGFPREYAESERVQIGCSGPEVGAAVLRAWEFPAEISEPVRWQQTPLDAGSHRRLACLLHVARWMAAQAVAPDASGKPCAAPEPRCLAPLRLALPALVHETEHVRGNLEEIERRMEMETTRAHPVPST